MRYKHTTLLILPLFVAACTLDESGNLTESVGSVQAGEASVITQEQTTSSISPPNDLTTQATKPVVEGLELSGSEIGEPETNTPEITAPEITAPEISVSEVDSTDVGEQEIVVIETLVVPATVEPFETLSGVSVEIEQYKFSELGNASVRLILSNNSNDAINNASCDVIASNNGVVQDTATAIFAILGPINAGERAADDAVWFSLDNGFSEVDKLKVECDWINGYENQRDIISGQVSVGFTGYSNSSITNKPSVSLLITNNSASTIYNAVCGVEAKQQNTIVDVAEVIFADLNDIPSGQAIEGSASWLELASFDEFDAEPFTLANVNCTYLEHSVEVIKEPEIVEPEIEEPVVEEPEVEEIPPFNGTTPTVAQYDLDGNGDVNCSDFDNRAEAILFFNAHNPEDDPHKLDVNGDGEPCESLR